jgi:hypothetical protein
LNEGDYKHLTAAEYATIRGPTALYTKWDVDAPPLITVSQSDEFDDSSIATKWSEFDVGNKLTVTESGYGLFLEEATINPGQLAGLVQVLPSGNFTIIAKMDFSRVNTPTATQVAGLALWEQPADVTKKVVTWGWNDSAYDSVLSFMQWSAYTTGSNQANRTQAGVWVNPIYLRIRRNGTTYYYEYSMDGIGWILFYSQVSSYLVPTYFGPCIFGGNVGTTIKAAFKFIRYYPSDHGQNFITTGRPVSVYA